MTTACSHALFTFAFGVFLISVLSLLKRRDQIGQSFFFFSLPVTLWALLISMWITQKYSYETTLRLVRYCNVAALFVPVTWLHFIALFTTNFNARVRTIIIFLYGATALIFPFTPTSVFFVSGLHSILGLRYYTSAGPLYWIFTAMFCCVVPYGFAMLFESHKRSSGEEKLKIKFVIVATIIGFVAGGSTFLPVYGVPVHLGILFIMPIYPFLMGVALIRYGLFEESDLAQAAHRDKLAAIGTIATSINHEIRNPLYIIHGMAESFLENFRGENQNLVAVKQESVAAFERTAQQAKRAMEIMGQLSLFAKQKIDDPAADLETANLSVCLDNVLPLIRHEMALEKIKFEKDIPETLPAVKANPRQMEEILFNLIVNACQAMKPKGGTIRLSAKHSANKVIIQIEDNGPGIPQDRIKQIFEPFYTTKEEGTGLGLYITRQLVEKNGGKIRVDSHEGKGTAFNLEFPI